MHHHRCRQESSDPRAMKRKRKMRSTNFVKAVASSQVHAAARVHTQPSSDDRRGDMTHNTLYVLGFGLAGAILANAMVLALFT
jgi:hypothetical protein